MGGGFHSLGEVIDTAKQNGFKIDAVTVFTQTSAAVLKPHS